MKITILGCGSSLGTPVIGCNCGVCKSNDPKNIRTRSALLIQDQDTNLLVDCGFDIKKQLLHAGITKLDAVVLTHNHADHLSGLDELRVFSLIHKSQPLDFYMHQDSHLKVMATYDYLFQNQHLKVHFFDYYSELTVGKITLNLFKQDHVVMNSLGFRIGDFVYANDIAFFYDESMRYLQDIEILVVDCCEYKSTKVHAGLERVLLWHEQFKPKITYLTNLSHNIDYYEIQKCLPSNIHPAYDGLSFAI